MQRRTFIGSIVAFIAGTLKPSVDAVQSGGMSTSPSRVWAGEPSKDVCYDAEDELAESIGALMDEAIKKGELQVEERIPTGNAEDMLGSGAMQIYTIRANGDEVSTLCFRKVVSFSKDSASQKRRDGRRLFWLRRGVKCFRKTLT